MADGEGTPVLLEDLMARPDLLERIVEAVR